MINRIFLIQATDLQYQDWAVLNDMNAEDRQVYTEQEHEEYSFISKLA